MRLSTILCILPLLLVGCAAHIEPISGPFATVSSTSDWGNSFLKSDTQIVKIDGQQTSHYWARVFGTGTQFNIKPGRHTFVVITRFSKSLGSGIFISVNRIHATLKPKTNYQFIKEIDGTKLHIWLIDKSTMKSVATGSATYYHLPPNTVAIY